MSDTRLSEIIADGTLTDTSERCDERPVMAVPQLFVVLECDRLGAGGTRHSLANIDRVVIGRGPNRAAERVVSGGIRTLQLRVPDPRISSRHATIVRDGGRYAAEDLGSRNGTLLNGSGLAERVPLADGDILVVGHTVFLYRAAAAMPLGTPADFDTARSVGEALATLDASLQASAEALGEIAKSPVPVLVDGETGTGKELVARAIHRLSLRKGDFVAVNCGALPAPLVESQLFGHVRGAFSGASSDSFGFVRASDKGTLFLDEVGDLPLATQVALLRVLQQREVVPVGATRPLPVDLRVVAATHHDLEALVQTGEFRGDLYARLAGFRFRVPSLRERRQDIGVILAALAGGRDLRCTPEVGRALVQYDWPLNVRELEHALASAAALARRGVIEFAHLPPAVREATSALPANLHPIQERVVASLSRHKGNVSEVARELGTARTQVHRWMKRFGIDRRSFDR